MLYTVLIVIAVILSLSIIGLVLLQHGRGADTGAAFGAGASGSIFGSRGSATFLSRATAIIAALFFATCLALAWVVKNQAPEASLMDQPIIDDPLDIPASESIPEPAADIPE